MADVLSAELTREAATTRRVLERVPDEHLAWKPHAKSMALGQLAYHIAALPRSIADLMRELTATPPRVALPENVPVAEILATLDASVPYAVEKVTAWGDAGLAETFRLVAGDKTLLELPRYAVIRTVMLNHAYHHRGQLTVYLRLLDVPLPSVYGPSADEQVFG